MAITNSDGSIILTTKVEDAGLKKGMAKIISDQKTQLQSLTREYAKLITNNKQNTEEAKKLKDQIDKLSKSIKENEGVMQSFEKTSTGAFSRVGNALKSIAGYLAIAFSVTKLIQFSNEAGQLATQTEASVQRLVDIYGSASDSVGDFIDANARALGMSKAAAASFSSVYGNLFSVWADQATNAELTNRYLNMTAVVASKTGRTVEDVQERVRSGLLGNTEAIEDLGIFVNVKTIEMTDAFQRMANGKSWEQLDNNTQQQIRSMAILEQATAKYGDEVADTSATIRNRFNAAYQDFQNSWGNIVNTVLLPVLETLTQIFDIATKGLNVISGRSGQILENVELQEENTDKTAENIEEQTKNQKELNKELKKSLAGFDDIQILSANTADNTSGGLDSGLQGIGGDLGGTDPDGSSYVEEINATLAAIMKTVAISMIAIGLILLFTGNVGWGIGTIIFGVGLEGVSVAAITETDPSPTIINSLLSLQGVAVGASVALGIMMIFMGSKGLGIGLIAYGAVQLGVTIYEITQFDASPIESTINTIQGVAAGAMLALGFFLLYFKVNMPLAISLIAGGALLVVDEIFDIVEGGVSPEISAWINGIMLILEGAALVIGIILLATKVNVPLGVSLVATGAASLAKEAVLNWDAISEMFTNEKTSKWIAVVGIVAVVLGIILCYAHQWKMGVGLIALGASTLVTEAALNWNAITELFTNDNTAKWIALGGVLAIALGILLCFAHQWGWGIGLIAMGVAAVVAPIVANWDAISNKITEIFTEFAGIIAAAGVALIVLGIILCCTGVGIGLGIGLILAGAAGLATVVAVNWDSIVDWVKGAWDAVKSFWNKNIAPIFTIQWWKNLAIKCGNGLIAGFEGAINGIIEAFESMINWVVDGLNSISFDIPDWIGGGTFGINIPRASLGRVSIPRLAQGAVIPPNREFLAVLGDQKQGTNIEAPLQTIVDAFNIALAQNSGYNGGGNTEVVLEIDGREFGRAVVEQGDRENRRIGTRLVIV